MINKTTRQHRMINILSLKAQNHLKTIKIAASYLGSFHMYVVFFFPL